MIRCLFSLIFIIGAIGLGVWARRSLNSNADSRGRDEGLPNWVLGLLRTWIPSISILIGIFLLLSTSFVIVGETEVGHLNRIYFGEPMPSGQIIALPGQKGPQAEILAPGFHFRFLINVFYKYEPKEIVKIPSGFCGKIVALDGKPLRDGQIFADEWPEENFNKMLDAEYFLKEDKKIKGSGLGQKGPQISVLKPGNYRLNRYLFQVDPGQKVIDIESGHVGVVKSNVQQVPVDPEQSRYSVVSSGGLVAQVVPKGYVGVWKEVLYPGQYYLNEDAFKVIPIDTRVQTWEYSGGFRRRWIDLKIAQDGSITQTETEKQIDKPKDAVDIAVVVRIEGWEIPLDSRVLIQVTPDKAPYVVASVGNIDEIQTDILTPTYRSISRNVCGRPNTLALDLVEKRAELESAVLKEMIPEGEKAFVTVKEVRFGEPAYPPELMVAKLREQLAGQLKLTYAQEKSAQDKRIETEKSRAIADQQPKLIEADIARQAAEYQKEAMRLKGEGEKLNLIALAEGQEAQTKVLGKENVMQLSMLKEILEAAVKNPGIVKVPNVFVQGSTSGFEGAAAILGASNLTSILSTPKNLPQETGSLPAPETQKK